MIAGSFQPVQIERIWKKGTAGQCAIQRGQGRSRNAKGFVNNSKLRSEDRTRTITYPFMPVGTLEESLRIPSNQKTTTFRLRCDFYMWYSSQNLVSRSSSRRSPHQCRFAFNGRLFGRRRSNHSISITSRTTKSTTNTSFLRCNGDRISTVQRYETYDVAVLATEGGLLRSESLKALVQLSA